MVIQKAGNAVFPGRISKRKRNLEAQGNIRRHGQETGKTRWKGVNVTR